ncbi:phosphate/phosphite/phosphonate ABC transporter substrate-binding protein, partial [Roseicyclus sp.]|uniref:phosphate/phosphite/phosphonate ABC transporter substrate-binding protein n=1 Tax=Roseicyclus sp. TaxID=1914329 RepID=UPI003F9F4E0D
LRTRGTEAPEALDQALSPAEAWARPDLLLSQICNLPWRLGFAERVTLVAAPDLGLPDAPAGSYYSILVVRVDDPRARLADFAGASIALNSDDSQSGWGAPFAAARRAGIAFGAALTTGAHRESARAVAEGRADIAGIDAATWRMIARWDGFADGLRVLDRTPPTPALSYVTARGTDPAPIRAAMAEALAALPAATRDLLGLRGIVAPDPDAYAALAVPPAPPA